MLVIEDRAIFLTRGDTAFIKATPIDGDEDYTFQDGDKVIFRLRRKAGQGEIACEKECVIDFVENQAVLTLAPEDTENCEFKEYRYEFELVTADDEHFTFVADEPFTIGKELENHAQ